MVKDERRQGERRGGALDGVSLDTGFLVKMIPLMPGGEQRISRTRSRRKRIRWILFVLQSTPSGPSIHLSFEFQVSPRNVRSRLLFPFSASEFISVGDLSNGLLAVAKHHGIVRLLSRYKDDP